MARYFSDALIDQIRQGYFSAVYFNRTKEILQTTNHLQSVTMQVFQKQEGSILCGMEEVRELFQRAVGYGKEGNWIDRAADITLASLRDGDRVDSLEPVLHITGPYAFFAHLESIYLGILARRTLVATNIRQAVDAAAGKSVIFFADRFDYFLNQEGDGYAARVGGATAVCTTAQAAFFGKDPVGTIPHALIALYGGDTVAATEAFATQYPDVNVIALVDFDNDCLATSLAVARKLGKRLWGVRIDTSLNMVDKSLQETSSYPSPARRRDVDWSKGQGEVKDLHGVNPTLVRAVRRALDQEGFSHVKIVVSGGFTPDRIKQFEQEHVPVDTYGIGSAMLKGNNDFTADIVLVNGQPQAKKGRSYQENPRFR